MMRLWIILGLLVSLSSSACVAQTAMWPSAPIRLVVPYPPGTSGDIIIRKVAPVLAKDLQATMFVDNKGGANGNIAMEFVKNAPPDGHTFVIGTDIQFSISPNVYRHLPFDAEKDFVSVGPLAGIDLVLVAQKQLKADNTQELIALARAEPGKLTYASTGNGSSHQLYMELFKLKNALDILHVPYKGTGQATPDLISGQVDLMFFGSAQAISGVKGGLIKALGVGSLRRMKQLPGIATIAETTPDFQASNIWGIWAPAKTPSDIVVKMRRSLQQALADPNVRHWYDESALTFLKGGAEEMDI